MLIAGLLMIQVACAYPANPAAETQETLRSLELACRREIAAHPNNLAAYTTLEGTLLARPAERLQVLQAGLRVAPNHFVFQLNLGYCLRQLKRYPEALTALKRAATLDTSSAGADALVQAGLVAQQINRHTEAVSLFRDALSRGPHYPPAGTVWGYLARSFYAEEKWGEAVQAWDRAERSSPHGFIDEAGDRRLYERSRVLSAAGPQQ